jgi:hypothetical protein
MGGVFISYRRTDSDVAAGRLADDLSEIFGPGRVFRDIDSLEAGEDFPRALERALDSCTVVIALIGPRWSSVVSDTGQRRLDDPKDWVRLEIARALQRDIRVIPVLLSTTMPKESELPADLEPLLRRNAVDLTDRYWKQEVEELARALERIPGFGVRAGAPVAARVFNLRPVLIAVAVLAIVALGWWLASRQPDTPKAAANSTAAAPAAPPIDLSQGVRIRDTGRESAVAGLVTAMAMEASLAYQKRPVTLSARYLYEKAKTIDRFGTGTEGTDMSAAIYVAETFGAPPEDRWPFVAGARALPKGVTWAAMDEEAAKYLARTFRLAGYDDIAGQLAQGRPVLATVDVTSAWATDEAYKTGVIRPSPQDKDIGASVIAIVRFDPADGSIGFAHSWGVEWGNNGFGVLSAADAKKALHELWAIEVVKPQAK